MNLDTAVDTSQNARAPSVPRSRRSACTPTFMFPLVSAKFHARHPSFGFKLLDEPLDERGRFAVCLRGASVKEAQETQGIQEPLTSIFSAAQKCLDSTTSLNLSAPIAATGTRSWHFLGKHRTSTSVSPRSSCFWQAKAHETSTPWGRKFINDDFDGFSGFLLFQVPEARQCPKARALRVQREQQLGVSLLQHTDRMRRRRLHATKPTRSTKTQSLPSSTGQPISAGRAAAPAASDTQISQELGRMNPKGSTCRVFVRRPALIPKLLRSFICLELGPREPPDES